MGSAAVAVLMALRGQEAQASVAVGMLAVILAAFLLKRVRKAHFSWDANVLAVIGLPVFSYLLLRSRTAYPKGTVSWKGRHYAWDLNCDFDIANEVRAGRPHGSRQDAGATSRRTASS